MAVVALMVALCGVGVRAAQKMPAASSPVAVVPKSASASSLVFIDGGIQNAESLVRGVLPGHRTILLDPAHNEWAQISSELAAIAASGAALKEVHIVSHGAPGELALGNQRIDAEFLKHNASMAATWRAALRTDADVLLYGCQVGAGDKGIIFMKQLATLTGAKVAASSDDTGSAQAGGNWRLERSVGQVAALGAFNDQSASGFHGVLTSRLLYVLTAGTSPLSDAGDRIVSLPLGGGSETAVFSSTPLKIPKRFAVDAANNTYYVLDTDNTTFRVYRINLTASTTNVIYSHAVTSFGVNDVRLDLVNNKVYIVTADSSSTSAGASDALVKMDLDGSNQTTVASSIANAPTFLALDIPNGYAYVVDSNTKAIIKIKLSDGTTSTLTTPSNLPKSMEVDSVNGRLYFQTTGTAAAAEAADGLFWIPVGGGSVTTIYTAGSIGLPNGLALDVADGVAYVADNSGNGTGGTGRKVYEITLSSGAQTLIDTPASIGNLLDLCISPPFPSSASVSSLSRVNSTPSGSATVNWTLTFSTAVTGVTASNFSLSGGAATGASIGTPTTSNSGLTWNVPVTTGSTDGTLTLNLANATSLSLSISTSLPFAGDSYAMDKTAPTISIGSPSASITAGGPVTYTVTYADANFNSATLTTGNITLNSTGTASGSVAVTGSGTTRTVTISGITGNGTLGISIASGTASDTAGNTAAAAGPSTTFTVDNTAPSVVIGSPSASITAGATVSYTVTYSDANFDSATLTTGDITLNSTGSANGSVAVTGSGTTWTVTISGITGDGTLGISIASGTASDTAGNTAAAAGPSTTFTVDNTAPVASISTPSVTYTKTGPIKYTATWTDANLNLSSINLTAIKVFGSKILTGTAAISSLTVSNRVSNTQAITLNTVSGNGTISLVIPADTATDLAGNTNAASSPSVTVIVDNIKPAVTISAPSVSVTQGGPVSYTVTYSDANLDTNSISLLQNQVVLNTTGTAAVGSVVVSGTGTTRTVQLSGIIGDGTVGISIPAGTASDLAGNSAAASSPSTTFTVDNTAPSVAIGSPSASITAGGPVSYTVTYTDANFSSATLATGDITLNSTGSANASSVVVSGSGTTRTVTLSGITGDGTLGISIASGTASDTVGATAAAAGPSTTFTVDNTAPSVVIGSPSLASTTAGPVTFTITYSDANFNTATLSSGDITLNKTSTANGSVAVSGSGTTRTVTISSITGVGTLGISIAAGTATDTAGNLAAAAGPSATFSVDNSPAVTTVAATNITVTGATLNATINPNGLSTTAAFLSGQDTNYGTISTISLSPDDSTTNQDVSVPLTGLMPNTTYHFLAIATNSAGVASGADLTFTTAVDSNAPTAINLSNNFVPENQPSGTVIGTLSATDADAGDTQAFSLVSGAGSTDNASFSITGNQLQTAAIFDYEAKNSYSIRVRVTDSGGLTFEQAFTINISDVNEPPVFNGYNLTVAKDATASVLVTKLIAKTTDPENNPRSVTSVGTVSTQGGTVSLSGSLIHYTPPLGYTGSDSFSVVFSDGSLTTTGFVLVNVGGAAGSGPALVSITVVGSDVQLKFSGIPGTQYYIQRSTTLVAPVTWTTLATVTANASGFVLYTDSSPPSPSYWRTLDTL